MRKLLFFFILAAFLLIGGSFPVSSQSPNNAFAPDEVLVKFKDTVAADKQGSIHQAHKAQLTGRVEKLNVDVVKVEKDKVNDKVAEYQKDPAVEYAEPNYIAKALDLTNDPYLPNQWGMYKVKAADPSTSAWTTAKSDPSVKVAILDTGIDQDHPDLSSKIVAQNNCTTSSTLDDLYGHGTHVAGIAAAATNNGTGVAGIGYNASLMNAKGLGDDGSGYYSWLANCIVWAADSGANVINMSLGGSAKSQTLQNAVNYAWNRNVVLVAAAGNSGNSAPSYPAYYTNVIAVAATDQNDQKPSWSSYGKWVDVAAPGVSIYSTLPNHTNVIGPLNYGTLSGTSMATPHVAGLAALVWPTTFGSSNTNVRRQIEGTADKITGTGTLWAYGRINALRAVTQLGATASGKH